MKQSFDLLSNPKSLESIPIVNNSLTSFENPLPTPDKGVKQFDS